MATPLDKLDPKEAWRPAPADRWNLKWAAHLFRRAAFGVPPRAVGDETSSWELLQQAARGRREEAIERLVSGASGQEELNELMLSMGRRIATGARVTSMEREPLERLQGWWLYRMLHTPHPLLERMTLLWHNHFATSVAKIRSLALMFQQNQLLRRHALGKFRPFLLDMSRDPAMMVWLDSNSNVKGKPNENFARELMELFSLGVGNYTERDIREAARAFTGWSSQGDQFVFQESQHDDGEKTVLGEKGKWNGEDIVRIVLERPVAGRFLARKLFREFINDQVEPPDALLEPLAAQLRGSYDIGACLRTILNSQLFFSEHAYRQRIKSPVEYTIGLVRIFDGEVSTQGLAAAVNGLGQSLFEPPNVAGWKGGRTWLNSATLVARHNLAWRLLGGADPQFAEKLNPARLAQKYAAKDRTKQADFLLTLLIDNQIDPEARSKLLAFSTQKDAKAKTDDEMRAMAHTIALLPEYQLA
jgi:uncharacterized protein (DUF1800 family)